MKYRILTVGSILILLVCVGCVGSGPIADFANGRMFSGKAASGNQTTTAQTPAPTSTQVNAASTTTSISSKTVATTLAIPRNLTCDRKWGELANDQCYIDFAISLGDVRICENLTYKSLRESCFYSIGVDRMNLSACNMVEDDIKRKKCFDVVQQNENST